VSGSTDATIVQFLTYLAKERDVSPHTLAAYGRDLEGLRAFLIEHLGVASVDPLTAASA
jgi:site-specific recombinase XerC